MPTDAPFTYFFREKSRQKSFLQSFALPLGMPPCGAADDRPAATALPHQAVCVRREIFYIFVEVGPSGPRVGQKQILILPAGRILLSDRRASLVPGVRGKGDYERPLREGAHRSRPPAILSCLSDRSERHIVSPRRAEPFFNCRSQQYLLPSPDTPPEPGDPKSASCGPDQRPPGSPSAPHRSAG